MKKDKAERMLQNNPKLSEYSKKLGIIRAELCGGDNKVFAEKLGVSTAYSSALCNAKEPITQRTLEKILTTFPEVNRSWLYFGEGEMLVAEAAPKPRRNIVEASSKDIASEAQVALLRDILREKDKQIAELTADNALLRKELRELLYEKEGATAETSEQHISTATELSTIL